MKKHAPEYDVDAITMEVPEAGHGGVFTVHAGLLFLLRIGKKRYTDGCADTDSTVLRCQR